MKVDDARMALMTALLGIADVSAASTEKRLELDNAVFKTPAKGAWYSVHFSPNNPVPVTAGPDGEDEVTGFLQVDVCVPLGSGEADALKRIQSILDVFKTGSKFTRSGQTVMVTSAGRNPGFNSDASYKIPVTIAWETRYSRSTP